MKIHTVIILYAAVNAYAGSMREQRGPGYYGHQRPAPLKGCARPTNRGKALLKRQRGGNTVRLRRLTERSIAAPAVVSVSGLLIAVMFFAMVIPGTPAGSETRVNEVVAGNQQSPAIAIGPDGEFMIVWESEGQDGDGYGVYARLYYSSGTPKGSEFLVNSETAGDQRCPSVAHDGSGNYIVVWQSWGDYRIHAEDTTFGVCSRTFDGTGNPSTPEEELVNLEVEGNQVTPCVGATSSAKYVIAWADDNADGSGNAILGRRYSSGGQPPETFLINTYTTGHQHQPAVATAGDSSFVVVWCSEGQDGDLGGIYGQGFSTGGAPQGSEFRVNSWVTGNQSEPSIAVNDTDCYIVVWSSEGKDGDGMGVSCQMFDEDLAPISSEFTVNTHTSGNQMHPAVAARPNGTFVVVWSSESQDGSGADIYCQEMRTNGEKVGLEFRANSHSSNNQTMPDVGSDSIDSFVVTWQSEAQDGDGYGVFFQRYSDTEIPEFSNIALLMVSLVVVFAVARRRRLRDRPK